jgi:hypothetical protein
MNMDPAATTGLAAGVPYVALPPEGSTAQQAQAAPAVFVWHLMDPPRTERAMSAALPLVGLPAWRIYLGLPLSGSRLPAGGLDEVQRLGYEDAVEHLHGPITFQAAAEFPAVHAELRKVLGFADGPIAVVGASNGSAVAQLVIADVAAGAGIDIAAAVLISPVTELRTTVQALAARFGFTYEWRDTTTAMADRLDFVRRAADVAATQPAVRLVVGAEDDLVGIVEPARRLERALRGIYDDAGRIDLVEVAGMAHALADEPGTDPSGQTANAAAVDRLAAQWLQRFVTCL